MTDKRERTITDPGLGPKDPHRPSTLRSLEAEAAAELNPNAPVYYEPTPLVAISNHKTLEVQTVKLSDDIDPRKLQTELRLDRVPSYVPPSDSCWPPETALASSQPPPSATRRWRAPAVLIAVSCALLMLIVGRSIARRSAALAARQSGIAQTVSGAGLAPVAASPTPVVFPPASSPASAPASAATLVPPPEPASAPAPVPPIEGAAAEPTPAPLANAASSTGVTPPAGAPASTTAAPPANAPASTTAAPPASALATSGPAPSASSLLPSIATRASRAPSAAQHAVNSTPPPSAPLAASSASKPKRAIY